MRSPPTALVAALLLLLLQWNFLCGNAGPVGDASMFHLPYQMLVGDFARHGELLQWNPWMNGGSPDGAEPQTGALSPLAIAAGWLGGGTPASFFWLWLSTWCASAAGFALLARHLGAPPWAQVALGLAWSTSGVFTGHAGHTCFVHAFASLPWSVLWLDQALAANGARRLRLAAAAGAVWGLSGLAGYPGLVVICGLFLVGWTLVRLLRGSEGEAARAAPAGGALCLLVTGTVALAVLSPTWVAFFAEGAGYTQRTHALTREMATGWNASDPHAANPLEPRALWTAAHPGIAARAVDDAPDLFAVTSQSSAGIDVGPGAWVLALLALLGVGRSPRRWALGLLGLWFLGTAMGSTLPLRAWLYDVLPPARLFRHPALFRVGFVFALAVLAAQGSRRLESRTLARAAGIVAAVSAGAALLAHSVLGLSLRPSDVVWLGTVHVGVLAAALLAFRGRDLAATRTLGVTIAVGAALALRLAAPLVEGPPERMAAMARDHVASLDLGAAGFDRKVFAPTIPASKTEAMLAGNFAAIAEDLAHPIGSLLDAANLPAKVPVFAGYTALGNGFHNAFAANPVLLRLALGKDRVFFARDAVRARVGQVEFEGWVDDVREGSVSLVVHEGDTPPLELQATMARARLEPMAFEVLRYTPRELELQLQGRAEPGWLLVTERWAAGWTATVDGVEARVYPASFLWRAVELPAGARSVHFHYRLYGHPWLLWLSWGTLLAVALAALVGWRRGHGADPARTLQ